MNNNVGRILFYVFLSIFVATAIITLLGISGYLSIKDDYLTKLFYSLVLEVVGGIIALFKMRVLAGTEKIKIRFDVTNPYDIDLVPTYKITVKLRNADGREVSPECHLYHDDHGLCSDIEITNYKQTLSVILDINGVKYQGSQWLETRTLKLQKIN